MNLPFTTDQFLSVFEQYNQSVWPAQVFLNILGLSALILPLTAFRSRNTIIAGILGFFWLWIGIAYHYAFFISINPAASAFAVLNILQGLVFLYFGVFKKRLEFKARKDLYGVVGALFVVYAMILYPALGISLGHAFPRSPSFGLPCPTTIFTFGILLWTSAKVPRIVLVIPFLWSLIGSSAALTLGIYEDAGLLVAGLVGSVLIIVRDTHVPVAGIGAGHAAM